MMNHIDHTMPALPADVAALFPFAPHTLRVGGQTLHYVDEGSGDPVLMVHGNPTWSFYFRSLVTALRGDCRAIAVDHVGCGRSSRPADDEYPYDLARRVADLEGFVAALGLDKGRKLTLVLHDWGGMIGMAYAVRHWQRIGRIVLGNTAAFGLPRGKRMPLALKVCRSGPLAPLLVRGLNGFCRGAVHTCVTRRMAPAVRRGYLAPYKTWEDRRAVLRFVQDIPLTPRDRSYATVQEVEAGLEALTRVPMLIVWGERDFVFDGSFLAEWLRRFPHAEVRTYADAGHYLLEDAPERVVPEVCSFLARHPL